MTYIYKIFRTLTAAVVTACIGQVQAATIRVDDSGTVVNEVILPMRWKQLIPGRGADHSVEGSLKVAVRLDLTRWLNQPIRLYMALAPSTSDVVYARWTTQGRLLPGDIRTGNRTLIFNDVVRAISLEETIMLVLKTDGRTLVTPQELKFYFEIDAP